MATNVMSFDEKKWAFAMDKASEMTLSDFNRSMNRLSTSDLEWATVSFKDRKIYNDEYDVEADRTASFVWLSVLFWGGNLFGGKICVKPSSLLKKLSQYVIESGFVLYDTTDKERMETEHTFCFKIARNGVKIQGVKVDFSPVDAKSVSVPVPVAASAPTGVIGDVPVTDKQKSMGLPGLALASQMTTPAPIKVLHAEEKWQTVGTTTVDPTLLVGTLNRKQRRAAARLDAMSQPFEPVAEVQTSEPVAEVQTSEPVAEVQTSEPVAEVQTTAAAPQLITMTATQLSELIATTVSAALAKFGSK